MKKIAAYLIPVLACFAVGISASFFQASSIAEWYPTLTKPTLTPPNIVFPIAWSVLYLCMGLSLGRLIVRRQHKGIIRLWVLQLIANFLWSILFFTLRNPLAGFIDIVLLNILVGLYIFAASRRDRAAAWLFVPYLLWTLFAAYLNGYILLHGTPAAAPTTIQTESLTISKPKTERIMVHKMPELPYSTEALAPKMSKETFEYHYGKHLQTYVDNLNRLIPGTPYESMSLQEIVKKADGPIFNNAAQAWNHTFFFLMLTPDQKPMPQKLADRIARDFGSVEAFKEEFSKAATGLFGSGLDVARSRQGRQIADHLGIQCRQPHDQRPQARHDDRRMGTRLLYRLPQPPRGFHQIVLGADRLGQGGRPHIPPQIPLHRLRLRI